MGAYRRTSVSGLFTARCRLPIAISAARRVRRQDRPHQVLGPAATIRSGREEVDHRREFQCWFADAAVRTERYGSTGEIDDVLALDRGEPLSVMPRGPVCRLPVPHVLPPNLNSSEIDCTWMLLYSGVFVHP